MLRPAMHSTEPDYARAFSRNIGIVSQEEQAILRGKRIAIPGCGGVGALHAITLARLGIQNFTIADFDVYKLENLNRQYTARFSTLERPKAEVVRDELLDINPEADVRVFDQGV